VLTEHERQLLGEIEVQLGLTDPRLAARLAGSRRERMVYRLRARRRVLSLTGMAGGFALIFVFYASAPLVGLVGVGLVIAVSLANAARVGMACRHTINRTTGWWHQLGVQSDEA